MTRISIFLALVALPFCSFATHIVGGALTYEHLGGATYRVTLKLYRDCAPGNANFDANAYVEVKDANGTDLFDIVMPLELRDTLDPIVDTCVVKPGICVEEGIFTLVVNNMPPRTGGYHLFYSRCCRNGSLQNIVNPLNTGEQFYTFIPDNATQITNTSPEWVNFPPVFVCQNQPIAFDHKATDKDGDSLVYSLYTPYIGCNGADPAGPDCPNEPIFPGPTFTPVTWVGGFNANNPLGGGGLTIDPNGFLNGIPPNTGQYVVGVRVSEYRNGQFLGFIVRDFQFNVVYCPPLAQADIGPVDPCSGQTVTFVNLSDSNAAGFQWDFGDGGTSNVRDPAPHTYPGLGPYTVRLIIQPGTACADTAFETVNFGTVTADFNTTQDSTCSGIPFGFTDNSTPSPNDSVAAWDWDFGDGKTDTVQNPTHIYADSGTYCVRLIATSGLGCKDTVTKCIYAQPMPVAIGLDTTSCSNNACIQLTGSVLNAGGGNWSGSGAFTPPAPSTGLSPVYCPTAGEIGSGFADLLLVSTGNGLCPADTDSARLTFTPGPTAEAGADSISVCKDTSSICLNGVVTVAGGGRWTTNGSGAFTPNDSSLIACYIPTAGDFAGDSIVIYLNTINNGNCNPATDSVWVYFIETPVVTITTADTACASSCVPISVSTTTGAGTWSTPGCGTFTPAPNVLNPSYCPCSNDTINGQVTLIFTSGNNGLCRPVTDTLVLKLQPQPVAIGGSDLSSCSNNACTQLTGGVFNAGGGNWYGTGTFTPPAPNTGLTPVYCPTPAELSGGFADVYLVTAGNGMCPSDTDTVRITFTPAPTADAGPDTITVCKDTSGIDLTGTVTVSGGGRWTTSGDGTFVPNDSSLVVTYIPGTNDTSGYQVTLYFTTINNGNCNPVSDTVVIEFTDRPGVNITAADSACAGVCMTVTASSTTGSGFWTTTGCGTFGNPNVLTTTYCPCAADDTAGNVNLVFHSTNNGICKTVSDTFNVTLLPGPAAGFTATDACIGDTTFFTDGSVNGFGNIIAWNWNFGDATTSGLQNPSHRYGSPTGYTVRLIVTDDRGCRDTVQKTVTVHPLPVADFYNSGGCLGDPVRFRDTSTVGGGDTIAGWRWYFGDGDSALVQHPPHVYGTPGGYPVTLIVSSNYGCADTVTKAVNILTSPLANFTMDKYLTNAFQNINFTDLSTGGIVSWFWDFGDSSGTSTKQNPNYTYDQIGNYTIMLVVTDAMGCTDTAYKEVHIFLPPDIPTGFTPNGDGVNDKFYIRGGPYKELELRIYNNWGELIFVGLSQADGWDGTRDGVKQPMGVYVYTAYAVTEDGERHEMKGDVTLLR